MKKCFLLGTLVLSVGLGACTKENPYDTEYKEEVRSKDLVNEQEIHLYTAFTQSVSRNSELARPFWQGQEKLVKLRFTEKNLEIVEIEPDRRFADNPRNIKPAIVIPVTHLEYRCAEDAYGECTNTEEENTEVHWSKKRFFKPDFNEIQVTEINTMPEELDKAFGGTCYELQTTRFLEAQQTPDSLDFKLERVFKVSLDCLSRLDRLSDTTVSVVYHYSIHRLSSVASADYQALSYPSQDESTFGFFYHDEHQLDVDHRETEDGKVTLMNRWNPNRSEITYHLAKEFSKPENSGLRAATYKSFERMNRGLAAAGAKFRLVLKDWSGQDPGDLRNSMIIMVEDPIAAGLLGYGPSVTNPLTGEIISARTVMYPGVMKRSIRETYEEIRLEREQKARQAALRPDEPKRDDEAEEKTFERNVAKVVASNRWVGGFNNLNVLAFSRRAETARKRKKPDWSWIAEEPDVLSAHWRPERALPPMRSLDLTAVKAAVKNYTRNVAPSSRLKDRIELMSEHCTYPAELYNFSGIIDENIDDLFEGRLSPWDGLSDEDKMKIVDRMLPLVWTSTLIHEVGHNLGLRHNFQGSEDKENWYTRDELDQMGVKRDIPYSTVMEYSYNDTNSLPTLGKYDIAALRYGYARRVETADGKLIPIEKSIGEDAVLLAQRAEQAGARQAEIEKKIAQAGVGTDTHKKLESEAKRLRVMREESLQRIKDLSNLKDYGYCTDEHVGINAGCKRFDEGTTYTEIAQFYINRIYNEKYRSRNFRDGRRHFSLFEDGSYAERVHSIFMNLRVMYEVYEKIKFDFGIPDGHAVWTSEPFLADLRQAAWISANFLIDVVKIPDMTCAVAKKENPSQIVFVDVLHRFAPRKTSCFADPGDWLNDEFIVVGQAGRLFASMKDPNSGNPYADQIDVRGIWMDKILALQLLTKHELGSLAFDRYTESPVAFPGVEEKFLELVDQILLDEFFGPVEFDLASGEKGKIEIAYGLAATHTIPAALDPRVMVGFPGMTPEERAAGEKRFLRETTLSEELVKMLVKEYASRARDARAQRILERYAVYREFPSAGRQPEEWTTLSVGTRRFIALKENVVALKAIQSVNDLRLLKVAGEETVRTIVQKILKNEQAPEDATEIEKKIYAVDPGLSIKFLSGGVDEEFYIDLLNILPVAD